MFRLNTVWEEGVFLAYTASMMMFLLIGGRWLPAAVTVLFLSLVGIWDLRWHRIPNIVTYPTMAVGVSYHTLTATWSGMALSLEGLFLGGGLLLLVYLFKGIGPGDVKALAALGAVWGARPVFNIFLATALLGGVAAVGILVYRGQMIETMKRYWLMGITLLWTQTFFYVEPSPMGSRPKLPYGVVISGGFVLWYLLGDMV